MEIYKQWEVEGIKTTFPNGKVPHQEYRKFVVRYTSDRVGKSLSIADEKDLEMFHIPLEPLKEILGETDMKGGAE